MPSSCKQDAIAKLMIIFSKGSHSSRYSWGAFLVVSQILTLSVWKLHHAHTRMCTHKPHTLHLVCLSAFIQGALSNLFVKFEFKPVNNRRTLKRVD